MAGIYQRNQTWWVCYRVCGKLVRQSLGTDNRKLAQAKLNELEYLQSTQRLNLPSRTPIEPLLEAFTTHMRATRKHKSAQSDIGRLRRFFESCPVRYLEELTAGIVQDYLNERIIESEITQKTANEYRVVLHTLFEYALNFRDFVPTDNRFPNPIKRVKRFKVSAKEIRFLTMRQIDEQLDALTPWPELRAIVAVCIFAGLRRAEALWLTVEDVKLRGSPPLLHIRAKEIDGLSWEPKTKQNRIVPISRALLAVLSEYQLKRGKGGRWYFPSPMGCRWNEDNFSEALREAQRKTGLPWTCLDYRHTFGSQLAQKGESLYKISKLMGNSPEICRKHYAALVPEELTDTVEFALHQEISFKGEAKDLA